MKERLQKWLTHKVVFCTLLVVFCLSSFSAFWFARIVGFPDEADYWHLAKGMHHNVFSAWYFIPVYSPGTLRTWGYPSFLYLTQFFSDSYLLAQIIQFCFYMLTVWLAIKIVRHFCKQLAYCSILVLLLIFNNHLAFYSGVLVAESLTIFFVTFFVYVYLMRKDDYWKFILLAIISFVLFQLRPVFLLFPFCLFLYHLIWNRNLLKQSFVYLGLFGLSLLPFGLWNMKTHGVFKITPLEGGMGVMHEGGFWEYRLPIGFKAPYYWGVQIDNDALQPSFLSPEEKQKAAVKYVNFWENKLKELNEKYQTPEDRMRAKYMTDSIAKARLIFPVYSATYTLAREKMLRDDLMNEIKANPVFYLKTRVYTFFRQWVTGINVDRLKAADSLAGYVKALYPFLVTFVFILCGLVFILFQLLQKKISFKRYHILFLFIFYCGIMNLPFVVMAKYTVPVHLLILILLSVILGDLLLKTPKSAETNMKKAILTT